MELIYSAGSMCPSKHVFHIKYTVLWCASTSLRILNGFHCLNDTKPIHKSPTSTDGESQKWLKFSNLVGLHQLNIFYIKCLAELHKPTLYALYLTSHVFCYHSGLNLLTPYGDRLFHTICPYRAFFDKGSLLHDFCFFIILYNVNGILEVQRTCSTGILHLLPLRTTTSKAKI